MPEIWTTWTTWSSKFTEVAAPYYFFFATLSNIVDQVGLWYYGIRSSPELILLTTRESELSWVWRLQRTLSWIIADVPDVRAKKRGLGSTTKCKSFNIIVSNLPGLPSKQILNFKSFNLFIPEFYIIVLNDGSKISSEYHPGAVVRVERNVESIKNCVLTQTSQCQNWSFLVLTDTTLSNVTWSVSPSIWILS